MEKEEGSQGKQEYEYKHDREHRVQGDKETEHEVQGDENEPQIDVNALFEADKLCTNTCMPLKHSCRQAPQTASQEKGKQTKVTLKHACQADEVDTGSAGRPPCKKQRGSVPKDPHQGTDIDPNTTVPTNCDHEEEHEVQGNKNKPQIDINMLLKDEDEDEQGTIEVCLHHQCNNPIPSNSPEYLATMIRQAEELILKDST